MKLELPKEWFENQLPHETLEVGACNPAHESVHISELQPTPGETRPPQATGTEN